MVISYIYSTCWCMKSIFYECQQPQPKEDAVHIQGDCNDLSDYTPLSDPGDSDSVLEPVQEATEFRSYGEESPMVLALFCGLLSQMGIKRAPEYRVKGVPRPRHGVHLHRGGHRWAGGGQQARLSYPSCDLCCGSGKGSLAGTDELEPLLAP
jgi:hypothetical protein